MSLRIESNEAMDSDSRQRSKRLKKCDGFGTVVLGYGRELLREVCDDRWSPCCGLVRLYARMGLHRYNLLKLLRIQLPENFYIFILKIDEECFCKFILTCDIARPRGTNTDDDASIADYFYLRGSVPKCPPEDLFQNSNRFCVVKGSELQQNDWIRLYLELAVATTHTNKGRNHDLSNLKILKVAIETTEDLDPPSEGSLNALNALVYIRYEDSCDSRVGKDVDRIAIVKRTYSHGSFVLEGRNMAFKSEVAHGLQNLRI
ncbi:PREDICTED: UPF0725 protein At3g57210-like [Camelina sativa]|uniref:UPF0725 protein At3g57210-like n=1 Tax=Camelina sativa TaxID=90675 RepID=A0ABM1QHX6_CAMSA|nr:PREDICTED: UPF0725 protein At3g57210-like [Camelina sativa]